MNKDIVTQFEFTFHQFLFVNIYLSAAVNQIRESLCKVKEALIVSILHQYKVDFWKSIPYDWDIDGEERTMKYNLNLICHNIDPSCDKMAN